MTHARVLESKIHTAFGQMLRPSVDLRDAHQHQSADIISKLHIIGVRRIQRGKILWEQCPARRRTIFSLGHLLWIGQKERICRCFANMRREKIQVHAYQECTFSCLGNALVHKAGASSERRVSERGERFGAPHLRRPSHPRIVRWKLFTVKGQKRPKTV